jgi:hypothetical protein
MITPLELEASFVEFSQNLQKHAPDGIIEIDLQVLHAIGLLKHDKFQEEASHEDLMDCFHVLESADKVALFNEEFVVWISPKVKNSVPMTVTFIALLQQQKPRLELVFSTSGVYNTPTFILKVLEHFLSEVVDMEKMISSISPVKKSLKKKNLTDKTILKPFGETL